MGNNGYNLGTYCFACAEPEQVKRVVVVKVDRGTDCSPEKRFYFKAMPVCEHNSTAWYLLSQEGKSKTDVVRGVNDLRARLEVKWSLASKIEELTEAALPKVDNDAKKTDAYKAWNRKYIKENGKSRPEPKFTPQPVDPGSLDDELGILR